MRYSWVIYAVNNQNRLNPNALVPYRRSGAWLKENLFNIYPREALFTKAYKNFGVMGRTTLKDANFTT